MKMALNPQVIEKIEKKGWGGWWDLNQSAFRFLIFPQYFAKLESPQKSQNPSKCKNWHIFGTVCSRRQHGSLKAVLIGTERRMVCPHRAN
jgi:hypothetical protein